MALFVMLGKAATTNLEKNLAAKPTGPVVQQGSGVACPGVMCIARARTLFPTKRYPAFFIHMRPVQVIPSKSPYARGKTWVDVKEEWQDRMNHTL